MVSFKSVLIAALAVTSASAHPSRFGRRHNGHGHGGRPSAPAPIRFQNSTIPAVESLTTVSSSSAVLSTGIPDVVTSAPVVSSTPLDPVIVTETTTTEIYTTVTVSYTLGNGKVVTTAFSKVRQPSSSTTSSAQQTVTVIPVATPEELDETAAAASPTAAPTVSTIEPVEEIFTTSTSTTTVYTTVYRTKSPSTPSAAAATPGFDGLVNDFITKFPQVGFGSASSLIASACSKISPATVTVGVPAATVTETVEVAATTVTSVSVSVSYVTVGASATSAPVVPAPSSPVDFETILPTETASPDTEEAPVPTSEPATSTETAAPIPTQIPPFGNNTVPLFPNATNPETVTRITATVVPIAPTATGTF